MTGGAGDSLGFIDRIYRVQTIWVGQQYHVLGNGLVVVGAIESAAGVHKLAWG